MQILKERREAQADYAMIGAVGAETTLKTRANQKVHKNRRTFLTVSGLLVLFFVINAFAPSFNCKKDRLDSSTVQFSIDPLHLIFGQRCEISVFNHNGKKVSDKDFRISSSNSNVQSSGLFFWVSNNAKTNPFEYLDGRLVEISGNITIVSNNCNQRYDFPFRLKQSFVFDKSISCKGEKKEFAVARYKNTLGKDLFVVIDINKNQLYLLEAPISIDASGVRGRDGNSGNTGKKGVDGTQDRDSHHGGRGGDGGDGYPGDDGGDGGEIIVYLPKNIQGISVNVAGGTGGNGGAGGKGGSGGKGYSIKIDTGKKGVLGGTIYEEKQLGKDGPDGNDGRRGQDGGRGRDGDFRKIQVDDIKKYFEYVGNPYFNIENIDG